MEKMIKKGMFMGILVGVIIFVWNTQVQADIVLTTDATGTLLDDGSFVVRSGTVLTVTATDLAPAVAYIYNVRIGLQGDYNGTIVLGSTDISTRDIPTPLSYPKTVSVSKTLSEMANTSNLPLRDGTYYVAFGYHVYIADTGASEQRFWTVKKVRLSDRLEVVPVKEAEQMSSSSTEGFRNLVQNPGFEEADSDNPNQPSGFTPGLAGPIRKAKCTWESPGYNGKKSIAVETFESADLGYWETIVPVKPETEYVISFYYKCRSTKPSATPGGDPLYNRGGPGGPNLELGVVPEDVSSLAEPTNWSDIGMALGPVGGSWLPLMTEWTLYRQTVKTIEMQTKMRLKLRIYCYEQKVWFDDLSVVASASLPRVRLLSPSLNSIVKNGSLTFEWNGTEGISNYLLEYSTSPAFTHDTTTRLSVRDKRFSVLKNLSNGIWFWHIGVPDQKGVPCWIAESSFFIGDKPWGSQDTTPPVVNQPAPVPGMSSAGAPTISARFADEDSGVNLSSVRVLLDGNDVTSQAEMTDKGFTLRPAQPLSKGVHKVEVAIADNAGNQSNRLVWEFGIGTTAPMRRKFSGEVFLVNDEPYFPIGIYAYRCTPTDGRFKESTLAQAAAAGFDCLLNTTLVTESGDSVEDLDILSKYGIKCFLNISTNMKSCGDLDSAKTALMDKGQGQFQFKDHPCVLGYWADDPENLENTEDGPTPPTTIAKIENARKILKEYSPEHLLVWAVSNLPRLKDCVPTADVILSYRYPVPHMHPQMLYSWTLAYIYSIADGKPVWFNSQAFDLGYGNYFKSTEFRPTPEEMRTMAYYSLVEGVKGYALYAPNELSEAFQPVLWKEALKMASEMRYLAPALAAGKSVKSALLKKDSGSGSIMFREIQYGQTHILIAVNMSAGSVSAGWDFEKPTQAVVLFENRAMSGKSKEMFDTFKPFEVHIYRWQ